MISMHKESISEVIESEFGVTDVCDLSEAEKWQLYERLKISAQNRLLSPSDYTKEIIKLAEFLEL